MAYTQDDRDIGIETPFGKDVLLLHGFQGEEAVSRPFRFSLEMVSTDEALDFSALLGKGATIRLRLPKGERYFHGIVSRFSQGITRLGFTAYHAELVPWFWLLSRCSDCRIFQNISVPDIIETVFNDRGFKDFKKSLRKVYPPLDYCVQYRETDFNFVSRLMEQYGIFYYFEHAKGSHYLVMADTSVGSQKCPGQPKASYQQTQDPSVRKRGEVSEFSAEQQVRPGQYGLDDYNFETPSVDLAVTVNAVGPGSDPKRSIFDYPGEYSKRDEGEALVRLRMEEEEAQRIVFAGASTCRAFRPACEFSLTDHDRRSWNASYLLTAVSHSASTGAFGAGAQATEVNYVNSFTCIPASVPFRPPRATPKPIVEGVQTAVVVGKKGEELWVDKHGRVTVQFHWDRKGKRDEASSCPVRVAQAWAGKRWGALFLPRIGQEVLVEFLEGDPDRPLIIGSVYNADQVPPYDLPANQTRSTIKSNSSKGGGGSNEIRFEDKKGSEQVYLHAQRDLDLVVEHDRRESVGNEQHLDVTSNRVEKIGGEQHLKVGTDLVEDVGGSHSEKAGQEIHLNAGTKVIIEAGVEITLKGPSGFVKLDPAGVWIQGPMVNINSGGAPGVAAPKVLKSPAKPQTK